MNTQKEKRKCTGRHDQHGAVFLSWGRASALSLFLCSGGDAAGSLKPHGREQGNTRLKTSPLRMAEMSSWKV